MAGRTKYLEFLPPLPSPTEGDILIREAVDGVEEEDVGDPEEDEAGETGGEGEVGGRDSVAPEDCELQGEISREESEGEGKETRQHLNLQQEGSEYADISQGGLTAGRDVAHIVPDKLVGKVNDSLDGEGKDDPCQYLTGRVGVVRELRARRD